VHWENLGGAKFPPREKKKPKGDITAAGHEDNEEGS